MRDTKNSTEATAAGADAVRGDGVRGDVRAAYDSSLGPRCSRGLGWRLGAGRTDAARTACATTQSVP
jgi:hypothetical protein